MAEEFSVEDWLLCPKCYSDGVNCQYYKLREGIELICGTCGLKSHMADEQLRVNIDL